MKAARKTTKTTLMNVIEAVQDSSRTDDEVVVVMARLFKSRQVRLARTSARLTALFAEPAHAA